MASYVIYSGASDGYVQSSDAAYATAVAGSSLVAGAADTFLLAGQELSGSYFIYQSGCVFDTSSVSGSKDSAELALYGFVNGSTVDFTLNAGVSDFGGSITTADWQDSAELAALTPHASLDTSAGWSTSAYNALTSSGLAAAVGASTTQVWFWSSRNESSTAPSASTEYVYWYSADQAGTTQDPKLSVETSVPLAWGGVIAQAVR